VRASFPTVVSGFAGRALGALLLGAIAIYRATLSPVLAALTGSGCRFTPSCSQYAAACIKSEGPLAGALLAVRRIARCHPFGRGGFDPPPENRRRAERARECP